jgi:hypothetical protein
VFDGVGVDGFEEAAGEESAASTPMQAAPSNSANASDVDVGCNVRAGMFGIPNSSS